MLVSSPPSFSTNIPVPTPAPACCGNECANSPWLQRVDMICRVAIGVFALIVSPHYFVASFTIGCVVGAVYAVVRHYQNKPMLPEGTSKPVCAQGYLDFLTRMRFPATVGTLATAAFIMEHTRHDPIFYVPFCGLALGFLTGREFVPIVRQQESAGKLSQKSTCCAVTGG